MEIIPYSKQANVLVKPRRFWGAGEVFRRRIGLLRGAMARWAALSLNWLEVGDKGSIPRVGSLLFGGVLGVE